MIIIQIIYSIFITIYEMKLTLFAIFKLIIKSQMHQQQINQHANQQINRQQQLQFQISGRKIVVVLSSLSIASKTKIQSIEFHSDSQNMVLKDEEIVFPRAVSLSQENTYKIILRSDQFQYQGVFIATNQRQNVRLYEKQAQIGILKIFSKLKEEENDEQDVQIRIISSQKRPFQQTNYENQESSKHQLQLFYKYPVAKSPFVKLTIRSIRPTRSNFKLKIKSSDQSETKVINFPNENELLLKNAQQWTIRMIDEHYEDIIIKSYIFSNTYCFIDSHDKKVHFTCIIQIEQCWQPQLQLGLQQRINILIHFQQLLSLSAFKEGNYLLSFQHQNTSQELQFHLSKTSNRVNKFLNLTNIVKKGVIKIINKASKQVMGQFKFTLLIIKNGIQKSERYLLSSSRKLRLKIKIYQLRYNQIPCKSERIISMFNAQNSRIIQSWIKSSHNITEQQLTNWLRSTFQLTLVEIDALFSQFLKKSTINQSNEQQFRNLFKQNDKIQLENSVEIKQEFNIFDYKDQGLITDEQLKIVKKILLKNYKEFYGLLQGRQDLYFISSQLSHNFIIDQSILHFDRQFDYLSFFNKLQPQYLPFDQPEQADNKKENKNYYNKMGKRQGKDGFLSIKIKEFKKISINKEPSTFLFKANGKRLAEPIHRCYSHKYSNDNYQVILPKNIQIQLEIFQKTLNLSGNWQYKLIEKSTLKNEVKVLGGSILFQIVETNHGLQSQAMKHQTQYKKYNVPQIIPFNQQKNEPLLKDSDSQHEQVKNKFQKSFWNKSLNQTKQKWSQYKNAKNQRNSRRGLALQLDQQRQNKVYKFDKEIL